MIQDIDNYILFLKSKGLSVSVHGKSVGGLIRHNIHRNPFCSFVKTSTEAWDKCIKCQQKVLAAYNGDYIFGMCYAGVEEYVFYVSPKSFVSVSGYGINADNASRRITRLANEFSLSKSELLSVYEKGLRHQTEDMQRLKTLVKPLCHMLQLLEIMHGNISDVESKNKLYDSILTYIQKNINSDISIRDIADACACSVSTVSHLFKEHTDSSVKKYITDLRIEQAKRLLSTSDLPIGSVALLCGFSNTNYFSTAFRKKVGLSPTVYRKK